MSSIPIVGSVANVVVGPAQLFVAPYGTTLPALTGAVTDFASPTWTEPGFTDAGIEWDYTPTFGDVKVDELLGPVKKVLTAHKLIINTKMAETTLKNLSFAIGAATLVSATQLTIGSPISVPEFVLGFVGPAPSGKIREGLIYRAVSIAPLKATYHRKDKLMYEVQFEALSDTTQAQASDLATYEDF